jgi:hypothetical protein
MGRTLVIRAKPRNPVALRPDSNNGSFDSAKFTVSERSESNGLRSGRNES